jgi:hypothetical protein
MVTMSRALPFTRAAVSRAIRGALDAGLSLARVEIAQSGAITLVAGTPEKEEALIGELDRELDNFEAKHGHH